VAITGLEKAVPHTNREHRERDRCVLTLLALSVLGMLGTDTLATLDMEGRGSGNMDEDSSTSSSYTRTERGRSKIES
jgi:hypothetical protein